MKNFISTSIIFFLLLLVSCQKELEDAGIIKKTGKVTQFKVDEIFLPYITSFETKAENYGKTIRISNLIMTMSADVSSAYLGTCEKWPDDRNPPKITINSKYWNQLRQSEKEQLVFHELGHCILSRPHRTDQDVSGYPLSVMNPYMFNGDIYAGNSAHYLFELYLLKDLTSSLPLNTNPVLASTIDENEFPELSAHSHSEENSDRLTKEDFEHILCEEDGLNSQIYVNK